MRIGGLHKQSLIDFPGRISAVLFLAGCNFRCPYCHNPSLIAADAPEFITMDAALSFLDSRKGFLDGVVISGGEPTLYSDLPDLCRAIQAMDLAVKLDTNGSRPAMVGHLIEHRLIDTFALDVKTVPSEYGRYTDMFDGETAGHGVLECIEQLVEAKVDFECRTTCASPFVSAQCIGTMAQEIQNTARWILQPCRQDVVLDADFMAEHAPHPDAAMLNQFCEIAIDAGLSCTIR